MGTHNNSSIWLMILSLFSRSMKLTLILSFSLDILPPSRFHLPHFVSICPNFIFPSFKWKIYLILYTLSLIFYSLFVVLFIQYFSYFITFSPTLFTFLLKLVSASAKRSNRDRVSYLKEFRLDRCLLQYSTTPPPLPPFHRTTILHCLHHHPPPTVAPLPPPFNHHCTTTLLPPSSSNPTLHHHHLTHYFLHPDTQPPPPSTVPPPSPRPQFKFSPDSDTIYFMSSNCIILNIVLLDIVLCIRIIKCSSDLISCIIVGSCVFNKIVGLSVFNIV